MALSRDQKTVQLAELQEKIRESKSIIFAQYSGLTVSQVSDLRGKLREQKSEMKVAKKTLMRIAAREAGYADFSEESLDGAVACIFSFDDPLTGAQVAFKFSKTHPQVALIGGIFNGALLSKEAALAFARMPTRLQLLAMFMSMCQSPLQTFAAQCSTPMVSFARGISELAKKGGLPTKA